MRRTRPTRLVVAARRGDRHGRHGRLGRSSVVRPPLPPLDGRRDTFELHVRTAMELLCALWPELRPVRFEIAAMPDHSDPDALPRWLVDTAAQRIVLFRVPIERMLEPGHDDARHRHMAAHDAVLRAGAEYLGREPWEMDPRGLGTDG